VSGRIEHLPPGAELTDPESFMALHLLPAADSAAAPARGVSPPPAPARAAALEAEIDRCRTRRHVARLAVHLASTYVSAAACFVVSGDVIRGEYAEGLGEGVRVEGTLIPSTASIIFANVVATGTAFRGAPPRGDLGRHVLRALGREHAGEVAVVPISLCGRVVSLLYADNGPEVMSDASAAALGAICGRVARAYARLILERKRDEVCRLVAAAH
jgi:hypothetical protein